MRWEVRPEARILPRPQASSRRHRPREIPRGPPVVGLPEPLIVLLRVHREHQEAERKTARQLWHDEGWVFAKPDGRPLNPNTDYHEWKALIDEAGLPDRR